MLTLFIRTVIVYIVLFAVLRIMGKRQISDMQPFDLIVTLMIADVASVPLSDISIPLFYGIIPVLALFMLQRLAAYGSLKSRYVRKLVCGKPVVVIEKGVILEDAMRAANYTLDDLTEQLRIKDVFSISDVEYGILETNGSLSVMPTEDSKNKCEKSPAVLVVSDGKVEREELASIGIDERSFCGKLNRSGLAPGQLFCASLESDGSLFAQEKQRKGSKKARIHHLKNFAK